MDFLHATIDDLLIIAEMNKQLIRDEGHRNGMDIAQLETRMRQWLVSEYEAVLFIKVVHLPDMPCISGAPIISICGSCL